jgi:hypothetical protein
MGRRALVLGGGITGIAWETGLIAGLAGLGIDLAAADVIIGTSAGSVVAQGAGHMTSPRRQAAALAAAGARVALVRPDRVAAHAIGHNVLDVSRRAAAAAAGRAQAAAHAAAVRAVWQRPLPGAET